MSKNKLFRELEEFPLSSYTQDFWAAVGFSLGQGKDQPYFIFSRMVPADEVAVAWYSNPAFFSMPEQKEVVVTSKAGKFTLKKSDIQIWSLKT